MGLYLSRTIFGAQTQTSKFVELPDEIKEVIYDKALTMVWCVDKMGAVKNQYRYNAAKKIQRWFRHRKLLPGQYSTPEYATRNTMIRYYLVKYEIDWLQKLPKRMIIKCGLVVEPIDEKFNHILPLQNLISEVRYFMFKYATNDVMCHYGW
jgi:hypothetical protein